MTTVTLYDIPLDTIIHVSPTSHISDGTSWFQFHHVDGMCSLCTTEKGGSLHLSAMTEIKHDGERYWIE